jgi:tetratricopeptide (TPR) repeat protein
MMRQLALAACLVSASAYADDEELEVEPEAAQPAAPVKDPKVAKKWLDAAKQLVQKGDAATRQKKPDEAQTFYENAATAYEKAIEASTDVNIVFDLAVLEEKAGRLDRAATHFRTLVKTTGARADLVKKATARFDDLTTKTGLLMILSKPEGATITDAGAQVGITPLADPLVLVPGTHTFAIAADGHVTKELELKIDAGSESERTITLEVGKSVPPPQPTPVEPAKPAPIVVAPPSGPDKLPLYIGAGAAGGFALIATITGIMAVSKHSTFEDENASPGSRADAKDAGKTLAVVTDVCLVGALAAGGFTAYWYFRKYKPAQRKMETKAAVVPWVKPDAGGLSVAGSF